MFKCKECDYESKRKYNLEGHIKRKHTIKEIPNKNMVENAKNIVENAKNIVENAKNIVDKFKCPQCSKILKNKYGFDYHIKVCKGVLNPLECHYCNKVLASASSKSKHIKTCKAKASILIVKEEEAKVINITNNYNIQLINFNMNNNEYTKFITDHIGDKDIIRIIKNNKNNFNHLIEDYLSKLYDNPLNICIRKISEKSGYSEVNQVGKWNKKLDSIIYPHLVKDVSNDLFEKIDDLIDTDRIKGQFVEQMHTYLEEIMTHNIDEEDLYILKNSINNIRRLKCFMLNQ